jgi:hypothetical protein
VLLLCFSIFAGFLGSILGLGGGIIIVPALTLILCIDIRIAVSSSLIAAIATSISASSVYVRKHQVHVKLGMLLETIEIIGAITGAIIAVYIDKKFIALLFGILLIFCAYHLLKYRGSNRKSNTQIKNVSRGLPICFGTGNLTGMLGVGGGVINVPVMNMYFGIPLKIAVGTSSFMICVVAMTSAYVYYSYELVSPIIAGIVAFGAFLGATCGSRIAHVINVKLLRKIFVVVMMIMAISMFTKVV